MRVCFFSRDGLPAADPQIERLAKIITAIASLWFALAAAWEFTGPFGPGHLAASASIGTAGENMFHWGIAAPVLEYRLHKPPTNLYYCHHPWGIFWLTALFAKVFGHHDWVCRLAPVLMSAATPALLYAIGRAAWSPIAGAVAAVAFTVLPIALAFANFNALELPVIFWLLLCCWATVRYWQTWQRHWLLISLGALCLALHADWPAYIFAAFLLSTTGIIGFFLRPRWFGQLNQRRFAQWLVLASTVCVLSGLFYMVVFNRLGKLPDLLSSATGRAAGAHVPLSKVLAARQHWIELCFTPLAIALGKLAFPVLLARLAVRRRAVDLLPLGLLVMATVQYVVFKQGADVHVYWPHYFAAYYALALGVLAHSAVRVATYFCRWQVRRGHPSPRYKRWPQRLIPVGVLGAFLMPSLAMARDGIAVLAYARRTGGRFNEKGRLIHPDNDKVAFIRWLSTQMAPGTETQLHIGMKQSLWVSWTLHRPVRTSHHVPDKRAKAAMRYFVLDTRFANAPTQQRLAKRFAITAVGPFWLVDRGVPPRPLNGKSFVRHEPSLAQRYYRSANDPIFEIVDDPLHTWERRYHLGQKPNPAPQVEPTSLDQLRSATNLAIAQGDEARAAGLRQQVLARLDRSVATTFDDGSRLLGQRHELGAEPSLTLVFEAAGPSAKRRNFAIQSTIVEKLGWSLIPPDSKTNEAGMPFSIPTRLWKRGFLYTARSCLLPRLGSERFIGFWRGGPKPPRPVTGPVKVPLLTLP